MQDSTNSGPTNSKFLEELISRQPSDKIQSEILASLQRIEEKLSSPQSVIITGPEVRRILRNLGGQNESSDY